MDSFIPEIICFIFTGERKKEERGEGGGGDEGERKEGWC